MFDYRTPKEFRAKKWGLYYGPTVAERFTGLTVGGLRLEVSPAARYKARVGRKIALDFRLYNESDENVRVTIGGTCQVIHQTGYMLIDERGEFRQYLGRGRAGGPHCFCSQKRATLEAHSSVQLDTAMDSDGVNTFAPHEPGKYVVIGVYDVSESGRDPRQVFSPPLVLQVVDKPLKN